MKNVIKNRIVFVGVGIGILISSTVMGQVTAEDFRLTADDGMAFDWFGDAVAISENMIAIGAYGDDDNGGLSGAVYLFDLTTGAQEFKLTPDNARSGDSFGRSIAIADGIVAVGALGDRDNGFNSGAAYLFSLDTGEQVHKLLPSDGEEGDRFGSSIAVHGGIVAVGARLDSDLGTSSGAVYLFDTASGQELFKLVASDGNAADTFGLSVALGDGLLVVSAPGDDDVANNSGAIYVFDTTTGQQLHKIKANDASLNDYLGDSVDIDQGVILVGSALDDDSGPSSGSAYLFDAASGTQLRKLLAENGEQSDGFGRSVSVSDGVAIVGAPKNRNFFADTGRAYVFDIASGSQITELVPESLSDGAEFGHSVSLYQGHAIVGAIFDSVVAQQSGSAFCFSVFSACVADLNDDGELNFFDVSTFLIAYNAMDPVADFTGDGLFNFFDVSAFLTEYAAGCP